eukprot:1157013-Pelagomonas_calceolata.AAC.2
MALSKHVEDGQGLNHLLLFLPLCLLSCTCEAWGRNGVKKQAFSVHVFSCVAGVNTTKSRLVPATLTLIAKLMFYLFVTMRAMIECSCV